MATSAHERKYTGLLARWARHCAEHPWRVILTWVGLIVGLGVLLGVGAGGHLRNEFKIPGSDAQRAADLIQAKFPQRQGAGMNVVFAAPPGQRLDTPERKAAVAKAVAVADGFKPGAGAKDGIVSIEDPFKEPRFSQAGRVAYADAVWNSTGFDISRTRVVNYENAVRDALRGSDIQVAFNGEAEQAPPKQGSSEIIGIIAALIILLVVFRTFTAAITKNLLALAREPLAPPARERARCDRKPGCRPPGAWACRGPAQWRRPPSLRGRLRPSSALRRPDALSGHLHRTARRDDPAARPRRGALRDHVLDPRSVAGLGQIDQILECRTDREQPGIMLPKRGDLLQEHPEKSLSGRGRRTIEFAEAKVNRYHFLVGVERLVESLAQ